MLTSDDGDLVSQEEYFPYGCASDRRDARNRYRFIGVERDEDTGLCMTGPRTYDPVSGRFLQGDPIAVERPHASPFAYASGSPIARLDPGGYAEGSDTFDDVDKFDPVEAKPGGRNRRSIRRSIQGARAAIPDGFKMSPAEVGAYILAVDEGPNPYTESGRTV